MSVEDALRNIRRELGLTQSQLAWKLGVHQPDISALETGRRMNAGLVEQLLQMVLDCAAAGQVFSAEVPKHLEVLRSFCWKQASVQFELELNSAEDLTQDAAQREGASVIGPPRSVESRIPPSDITNEESAPDEGQVLSCEDYSAPLPTSAFCGVDGEDLWLRGLVELGGWASGEYGICTLSEAVSFAQATPDLPANVRDAAARYAGSWPAWMVAQFDPRNDLCAATERIVSKFTGRERDILILRTWSDSPLTLEELGAAFGVSRERVRQVGVGVEDTLRKLLETEEFAVVSRGASRIAAVLGSASPFDSVAETLQTVARLPWDRVGEEGRRLLIWLAGPYVRRDDWLVRTPASRVFGETEAGLLEESDGGILSVESAVRVALSVGVSEVNALGWIAMQPGIRILGEEVLLWPRSLRDQAILALRRSGSPMTVAEIFAFVDQGFSERTLLNYLNDPPFRRLSLDRYGLEDWGGDEYEGISSAIRKALESRGGEACVADLARELSARLGVAESSVYAYASSHLFVRTRRGWIRCRRPDDAVVGSNLQSPSESRDCFFGPDSTWWFRTTIDSQTLRGSGRGVGKVVAHLVGIRAGEATTLHGPIGSLAVSWRAVNPSIGSLKDIAACLGGGIGDWVFLRLGRSSEQLAARLVRAADVEVFSGVAKIAAASGCDPSGLTARDTLRLIATSLGLERDSSPSQVGALLRTRGEHESADIVVTEMDASLDSSAVPPQRTGELGSLLAMFGVD